MKKTGAQVLAEWMAKNGVGPTDVAEAIGKSRAAVIGYRDGQFRPEEPVRLRIEKFTNGKVPRSAWETPDERERLADTPTWEPPAKARA
jgi:hypothetical protein